MTRQLTGFHVLLMLFGFFGVTIAVNVAMSVYAIGTFSGEDVSTPYLRGLAYNTTLRERAAQAALGWSATVAAERRSSNGVALVVRVLDHTGVAKGGLDVTATLRRPTNAAMDRMVVLTGDGDGAYRAELPELANGQWDIVVSTKSEGGVEFEAERRVVLK